MNFFVVAESFEAARLKAKQIPESFEAARLKAKQIPEFKEKRMHVDGLQEIQAVDGFKIELNHDAELGKQSQIINHKHRDLAPAPK